MPTSSIDDVFVDFDAAFDRLVQAAGDEAEQRRALDAALDMLYRLREHLKSTMQPAAPNTRNPYYALAGASSDGRTTEGVVALRGFRTHSVALPVAPKPEPLLPGSFFPGEHTYPGANLTWVELPAKAVAEAKLKPLTAGALARYRADVQGQMVLYTLKNARGFLRAHL